jgi:hypothetical protein
MVAAQHTRVVAQHPLTQQSQPIGYDRDEWMHKVNALTYYNYGNPQGNTIDPQLSNRIHPEKWNRSMSNVWALSGNVFAWSPVTELANIPTSGHPENVSQQYVQVPASGVLYSTVASTIRKSPTNTPIAYGQPQQTASNPPAVYQVPKADLASIKEQAGVGNNFFQWIVTVLTKG